MSEVRLPEGVIDMAREYAAFVLEVERTARFAIAALRSNQDVLLHNVELTQVVREQLEANRAAIRELNKAIGVVR